MGGQTHFRSKVVAHVGGDLAGARDVQVGVLVEPVDVRIDQVRVEHVDEGDVHFLSDEGCAIHRPLAVRRRCKWYEHELPAGCRGRGSR